MRALAVAAFLAICLAAGRVEAHAMPNSTVVIQPTPAGFEAAVSIPLLELQAALSGTVTTEGGGRDALERYVRAHVSVAGTDGRPWPMSLTRLELERGEHPALALSLGFARPLGADPREARLRYDAVNHRIASHYVLVYLRSAEPGGPLTPLGRLQFPVAILRLGLGGR